MPKVSQGLSLGGGVTKVNIHSRSMRVKKTCIRPAAGSCWRAMIGSSDKRVRAAPSPMGWRPAATWNQPATANMATRPCFNSAERHCKICSSELFFTRPAGSQTLSGKGPPVPSSDLGSARTATCFAARRERRLPASATAPPAEAQARVPKRRPVLDCCVACSAADTTRGAEARRAGGDAKASWAAACERAAAAPATRPRFLAAHGMA
mmetsp:Transcript_39559/g.102351  ORF Transcript_39559/g.102351 Transcript_39559/m.102351 type:complete len:208 (+) Transcript_39559:59-682(+)